MSDKEHQTVIDLIKEADRVPKLYPVGRLDRSTEGLLLVTNNGPLGYRMLHPKYHVAKTYYVEVNAFLADDAPAFLKMECPLMMERFVSLLSLRLSQQVQKKLCLCHDFRRKISPD